MKNITPNLLTPAIVRDRALLSDPIFEQQIWFVGRLSQLEMGFAKFVESPRQILSNFHSNACRTFQVKVHTIWGPRKREKSSKFYSNNVKSENDRYFSRIEWWILLICYKIVIVPFAAMSSGFRKMPDAVNTAIFTKILENSRHGIKIYTFRVKKALSQKCLWYLESSSNNKIELKTIIFH